MSATMNPMASIDRLSASIAQLSVRVDKFAEDVHEAKQDMEDLSEKLTSLEDCLEILEADLENPAIQYPDRRKKNLRRMLEDCDRITKEMATLLKSLATASGEVSWLGFSKTKMGKLQDSLEADTSAMLLVISMSNRPSVKEDHLSSLSNSSQDTESMLSIRQSLLETACVPYAIEDPYAGATSKSEQMTAAYHAAEAAAVSPPKGRTTTVHRDRNPISMRRKTNSVTFAPADRAIRGDVQGSQLDRARRLHGDINGDFVHLWSYGNATPLQEARTPIPNSQQFSIQKELVILELEALTEQLDSAKRSEEPIDLEEMRSIVLEGLTQSLNQLKDSFTPQIEESMRRKNKLIDETSRLVQAKDDCLREFEQLTSKNAQLSELHDQLVHQIQALYKAETGSTGDKKTVTSDRATTIHVAGISNHTDEEEVRDFFSFCGKITALSITPASDDVGASKSAAVTFEKEAATKTALLLDKTRLSSALVHVTTASV